RHLLTVRPMVPRPPGRDPPLGAVGRYAVGRGRASGSSPLARRRDSVRGFRGARLTVPAPLGRTPTKKMPAIQVFGTEESQATRAAIRFFRERRIVVSFVDIRKRPMAPAELRRFVDR